jgi:hypothetical protein
LQTKKHVEKIGQVFELPSLIFWLTRISNSPENISFFADFYYYPDLCFALSQFSSHAPVMSIGVENVQKLLQFFPFYLASSDPISCVGRSYRP